METTWRKETIADVVNLALGAILFLSPWAFEFAPEPAASWNAWLSGLLIVGLAIAALTAFAEWEEWLSLIVGIWVAASPWLVNFSANSMAMGPHLLVGVLVTAVAGLRIWLADRSPPHVTA